MNKNNTILLTGATGYLGGYLLNAFLNDGYKVLAVCLNHNETLKIAAGGGICNSIYLDTDNLEDVFKNNKIDYIVHTATLYGRNNENLSKMIQANVEFPLEILSLAIKYDVKAFINTSTILVNNISTYALTKWQFAQWLDFYSDKIKAINLKLDHFYGPKDKPVKFVAWLVEQFKNNAEKIDLTEGSQTRDFVYIKDLVKVYLCILNNMERIPTGRMNNFEIGSGHKTSIKTFVKLLKREMNNKTTTLNFGAIPYRKNEVLDYDVDTTAISLLGWVPEYTIEKGIKDLASEEII